LTARIRVRSEVRVRSEAGSGGRGESCHGPFGIMGVDFGSRMLDFRVA
jgi:hypothetical protein